MPLAPQFLPTIPTDLPTAAEATTANVEHDAHDEPAGPRAAFRDPTPTVRFMLGGRAYVTFESAKTGVHFTYRLVENKRKGGTAPTHFVAVLTGPDTYTYLGCLFEGRRWAHGHKSPISRDAKSAQAFRWVWERLALQGRMPETLEVYHEGRCGRCGRRLTTPESVTVGLGAECLKKMEGGR